MGCDIHIFIEFKVGDKPWTPDKHHVIRIDDDDIDSYHVREALSPRDYLMFAALAGVRGIGPDPKGVPKDVSELISKALDNYGVDGHSHSYSSLKELEQAMKATNRMPNKDIIEPKAFGSYPDYDNTWGHLLAYCKKTANELQLDLEIEKMILGPQYNSKVECRILYFFDN